MPIQITAKRDGFRRCGMAHSDKKQTYADDHFSAAQLQVLEAEDQLVVVRISDQQLSAGKTGELGADLQAALAEIATLTSSLNSKTSDLTTAQSLIEKLNDDLSQANTDLTAKQETITAQAAEIETLKAQVASLTTPDDKAKK
ncbi:HI1506-related protein [Rahnella aquatilis]|uniref:HI1506-related protein n=1 Tax=Rahnella aquatilis TaxID=34038 RepID=UPI003666A65F